MNALERQVRAAVMQAVRDTGAAPSAAELAGALAVPSEEVRGALHGLAAERLLVLQPGSDRVWMATPFSTVPTIFQVRIGTSTWFANCAWDGLAVIGLLGGTGVLETVSPATAAPLQFDVRDGRVAGEGLVHFLVPARRFWDDIGFT